MSSYTLSEVAPDVWCIRHPAYLTCSYLVREGDATWLVDAGRDSEAGDIRRAYAELGLSLDSLRGILLTHWHNDHAAGAASLVDETGAPVYYHRDDAPFCTRQTAPGGLRDRIADAVPEWGIFILAKGLLGDALPRAVEADRHVEEGEVVDDLFRVVVTQGHTPGHVSFVHDRRSILFAGDALAVVNGEIRLMARPTNVDIAQSRDAVHRLHEEDFAILCPGHREPMVDDVRERFADFKKRTTGDFHWPLFG
ncbi:MAG: MBL fold metallo-hydrolase [Acidobacteriota bacterium]